MDAIVVGTSFRSGSMGLRDRLVIEDASIPDVSSRLFDAGVTQAILLSTCDRVEVQAVHHDAETARHAILSTLAGHAEVERSDLAEQTYTLVGEDALRHMIKVASSLDSQVIGEPQVLGQVKAAHRLAENAGMVHGELQSLLRAVYAAAKRVRTETKIGEFPVSIAAAAGQLAGKVHGNLDRCRVLLLGDGDMGELVARHLKNIGAGRLVVSHPADRRAEKFAIRLGCHAASWSRLSQSLTDAEIVITSIGHREHSLSYDMMAGMVKSRHYRHTFAIDLAFPGDIDPAVNRIDEVFLYTLSDLEHVTAEGLSMRGREARHAESIVEEEIRRMGKSRAERSAAPALVRLRQHVDRIREQALSDAGGDAGRATSLLANRLLHNPTIVLREIGAQQDREELQSAETLLERLFSLDRDNADDDTGGE